MNSYPVDYVIAPITAERIGTVTAINKGATTAHVRLDVNGTPVTASITNEAVDELKLQVGQKAYAVVKASDVMIGEPHDPR